MVNQIFFKEENDLPIGGGCSNQQIFGGRVLADTHKVKMLAVTLIIASLDAGVLKESNLKNGG